MDFHISFGILKGEGILPHHYMVSKPTRTWIFITVKISSLALTPKSCSSHITATLLPKIGLLRQSNMATACFKILVTSLFYAWCVICQSVIDMDGHMSSRWHRQSTTHLLSITDRIYYLYLRWWFVCPVDATTNLNSYLRSTTLEVGYFCK